MKITFLLKSAYGMGGTIRATLTLAGHLAMRHEVEIITLHRQRADPFFAIDERIGVRTLMDLREGVRPGRLDARLGRHNSRLVPRSERIWPEVTLRGDYRMWQALRGLETDVLVTTRPAFNLLAARFAPSDVVVVGQEHLHLDAHRPGLREHMRRWYPRLDALVTLTEADRRAYTGFLADAPTRLEVIPNALPTGAKPLSGLDAPVIAAAGRMAKVKHYERLIAAFAKVAATHPDWILRLYGTGPELDRLRTVAAYHDLGDKVAFMGRTKDVYAAFAQASIVALSSSFEGFGMTIIEAFACGVPVVSFDCPQGPREIITHGRNGLLVPPGDGDALADALGRLIDDPGERRAMGAAAHEAAARYDIATTARQWETLLTDLRAAPAKGRVRR
ncbi:glycosyltransferase family 4 protein [Actinoallomurus sp. NPDC052274]|uniref:glycosyltransferase family 4 protein n=1 Tax=Actinoallomurus sp. NPDC052274 TaxID=3155420 RepID=UPI00343325F0